MNEEIREKIIEIYQEVMPGEEPISLEKELDWDSLDKMRFMVELEDELQTCFDDILVKIVEAKTLQELIDHILSFVLEES